MNQNTTNNKKSFWVSAVIILVALGMILTYSSFLTSGLNNTNQAKPNPSTNSTDTTSQNITYKGKEGVDAMTLLKQNANAETQTSEGLGEFVTAINGVKPADKQFWALYVNGAQSETGASQTSTKDSDTIEWKLVNY